MLFRKAAAVTLFISMAITLLGSGNMRIEAKTDGNIRVGLFFSGTACPGYSVSAPKGIIISRVSSDSSSDLLADTTGQLTVRKDAWFYKDDNVLKEYAPGSQVSGSKIGPYHLRLYSCSNVADAVKKVQAYRTGGARAYLAYTGQWEVWTGFYITSGEAQADIQTYQKLVGTAAGISVTGPSDKGYNRDMVIERTDGSTLLLFADIIGSLQLRPSQANDPCVIRIDGRNYRGALEFKRQDGSDITVINCLDIESYLYGVVPGEIESYSPAEALKSQALVARNYALCNMDKFAKWGFDLDTTVQTQVYKGYDAETQTTNRAVDETRGMVLKYGNSLAKCFYFSSSGGMTEDVRNVWGSEIPYLQSVDDPYESGESARYNWEKTISADKVSEIMKNRGYNIGNIISIVITKRSDAGRTIEMVVTGTEGKPVIFYREACRTIFGLDSQLFSIASHAKTYLSTQYQKTAGEVAGKKAVTSSGAIVEIKGENGQIAVIGADGKSVVLAEAVSPEYFTFIGKGNGHAVGLSQEGAKGFAAIGKKFDEILLHYFPGTVIGTVG